MKHRRSWWIKAEVIRPQGRTLALVAFQEDKTTDFAFFFLKKIQKTRLTFWKSITEDVSKASGSCTTPRLALSPRRDCWGGTFGRLVLQFAPIVLHTLPHLCRNRSPLCAEKTTEARHFPSLPIFQSVWGYKDVKHSLHLIMFFLPQNAWQGLGDGSVGKVVATQAQGPELGLWKSCRKARRRSTCAYNPSAGKRRQEGLWWCWLTSIAYWQAPGQWKTPSQNKHVDGTWETASKIILWTLQINTHMWTPSHTHVHAAHTQRETYELTHMHIHKIHNK